MNTTINFELAKLLKEKGFISYFNKEWKYSSKEPLRQLFELTELQQWLREVHNIDVESRTEIGSNGKHYFYYINCLEFTKMFNTYELALQQGLLEALKLI